MPDPTPEPADPTPEPPEPGDLAAGPPDLALEPPDLAVELAMIARAVVAARAMDRRVAVAVVDASGRLVAFHAMPGTLLTSDAVAVAKAYTSAVFGRSTRDLAETVPADRWAQIAAVNGGRIIQVPGGLPTPLGGVGVSGASADEDERIATAALEPQPS